MISSRFRPLEVLEDRTVPAVQVVFNFDYDTSGFFADAGRRAVLQQAADAITLQFNDQLSAIAPGGGNSWTAQFDNPSTGNSTTVNNLPVGQNQVVIFAGARNLGGPLGIGGYSAGAVAVTGTSAFRNAIQSRGQGNIFSQNATDFATWGGSIVFDTATNWSFATSAAGVGGKPVRVLFGGVARIGPRVRPRHRPVVREQDQREPVFRHQRRFGIQWGGPGGDF